MNVTGFDCFNEHESNARSYCRKYNTIFDKALGSLVWDIEGKVYLDFLAGAGALNYGHNHPIIKQGIVDYLKEDKILMSLDMHSQAKKDYIEVFQKYIVASRGYRYKMQFTSPTGTSCIESAVKLARKVTNRNPVISFTNGFHGMTSTSLALTGSSYHRSGHVVDTHILRMPFEGYLPDTQFDLFSYLRKLFTDPSSGIEIPAAVLLETIQGEGGLNVASNSWLNDLSVLCKEFEIILIIDDVQAGCGRSGKFFSFEDAKIVPDIVCLSKSIGGIGLPLATLLIAPHLDKWAPAEDNGTFRGNCLAFVAATKMIESFWCDESFEQLLDKKISLVKQRLIEISSRHQSLIQSVKGKGMMQGLLFSEVGLVPEIIKRCFERGLIIESCGPSGEVLKFMPPLTVSIDEINRGIDIVEQVIDETCELISNEQSTKLITEITQEFS